MIDALRKPNSFPNMYKKRPETEHVNCARILSGDEEYTQLFTSERRIPLIENSRLDMSCPAIHERVHSNSGNFKPLESGGVAFARVVYRDYEFIEKQVEISWHPQNYFCFVIDKKSPLNFHSKMYRLAECVENIIVLPATENYDSSGHNINIGHKRCMETLLQLPGWTYLLHLQNNDVITKTVYELSKIYEIFGGANDVNIGKEKDQRRVPGLNWDPRSMKLFRNEDQFSNKLLDKPMTVVSGSIQSSWSRAAVKWLIEEVDLTIAIDQFNRTYYAADEQIFPSLQFNKDYGMPGHYTDECLDLDFGYEQITRVANWASGDRNNCVSKTVRNGVCLVGIEELRAVSRMPAILINKMIPSFDYTIVECTAELLFNRTFLGQMDHLLDEGYYKTLPTVVYHKHRNDPEFQWNCTPSHRIWNYTDYL